MAYETYTTHAIVCGSFPVREHDRTLQLLTAEGGMLFARAGGTRAASSKLRYALQDFSYARVTLVRGKADWRVVGATALGNFYYAAANREARAEVLAAMRAIPRFIHGAGKQTELFAVVVDGLATLARESGTGADQLFMLRMLYHLGYVAPDPAYTPCIEAASLEAACGCLDPGGRARRAVEKAIENALATSHL